MKSNFFLALIVVGLASGAGYAALGSLLSAGRVEQLMPQTQPPEVDVKTSILEKIQDSAELTTKIYPIQVPVDVSQENLFVGLTVGVAKVGYMAVGQVRAGVNLQGIQSEDIEVTEDQVTITMSRSTIQDTKIDVSQSHTYEDTSIGFAPDTDLQTEAQQQALTKVKQAACAQDILGQADKQAQTVLSDLLSPMAGKPVVIKFSKTAGSSCLPG